MTASDSAATAEPQQRYPTRTLADPPGLSDVVGQIGLIAVAPASIIFLSFSQGGFFPDSVGVAAIGMSAVLVLRTTLAEHPFAGFNRPLAGVLLALALFAALQLASALWSHDTARALDEYDRTLLYLLTLTLFGSFPRTAGRVRWLVRALAAGMAAVCVIALISRVLPHLWPTTATFYDSRLNYPLTYWNAEGLLAAVASLLLIHLSASDDEPAIVRVAAAILVPATTTTLLLTFSRGALAVAVLAAVVYLVLGRPRALLGAAVALVPTSAVALHSAYAAQLLASSHPTAPAAVVQGRHVAITVGLCMIAAAVLRAAMLVPDAWLSRAIARREGPRLSGRVVGIVIATVVAIGVVGLVASGLAGRELDKFANSKTSKTALTRDRLLSTSGENRVEQWRIAFDAFRERPVLGSGAGTYALTYARHRSTTGTVTDAHNLYAQELSEQGIIGFLAIAAVIAGVLVLLAARVRGRERTTYAALFAVALAWAVHAGVDWDWEMPAATLWLFIAAGWSLGADESPTVVDASVYRNRTAMAIGFLVLAVAPLLVGVSYQRLRTSAEALAAGNCNQARQSAFSSLSLLSVRPEPYEVISYCDLQLGFPAQGLQAAQQAVHYEPDNWNYRYGLALALAENGRNPQPAANQALRLDPREPIVRDEVAAFAKLGPRGWEREAPDLLIVGLQSGSLQISNL